MVPTATVRVAGGASVDIVNATGREALWLPDAFIAGDYWSRLTLTSLAFAVHCSSEEQATVVRTTIAQAHRPRD
jgi:hypothetical protein